MLLCRFPKLSNVTLAFLKSSCRQQGIEEWRVYDVVATMRQQKERKQQARLPQPAKRSHHFIDDSPEEIEPDCSDTDTEGEEGGIGRLLAIGVMPNVQYFISVIII